MKLISAAIGCVLLCLGLGASAAPAPLRLDPAVVSTFDRVDRPVVERVHLVRVYTCTARSRVAYGVWTAGTLSVAKRGALTQCAIRTPRGMVCLITACR
jgi:hypothetical protein